MPSMQPGTRLTFSKGFVIFLGIFLLGILLALVIPVEQKIRARLLLSKYRNLSPHIITLARLESGRYTSNNFKQLNNIFNIKNAFERKGQPGYQVQGSEFRKYNFYYQSLNDLLELFDYTNFPVEVSSSQDFVQQLKNRGYFEEELLFYFNKFIQNQ